MPLPGQVTIAGETISGVKFTVSPVTFDTLPPGLVWEDLDKMERKVRIRFEGEAILTKTPSAASKYDADNGIETGDIVGELLFKMIREGFKVTAIQTPQEREDAWRADHGATEEQSA